MGTPPHVYVMSAPAKVTKLSSSFPRALLAYLVLPNLLFYVLGHFVYFMRPVVNVDFLLIGILAPFLGPVLTTLLYTLTLTNELFINFAPIFHFQIADAIQWLPLLRYVKWTVWVPGLVGCVGGSFIFSLLAVKLAGPTSKRILSGFFLFVICSAICAADILNGTSFISVPIRISFADFNIAYSGVRRTVKSLNVVNESQSPIAFEPLEPKDVAAGVFWDPIRRGVKPAWAGKQLALIVVESMGAFNDAATAAGLLTPLTDPAVQSRYAVKTLRIPFNGHTIDGELRELCDIRLHAYGEKGFPKCLPSYLHELGYETTGMHGFTDQFYNRYRWYPFLGFDHIYFAGDMREHGIIQTCGSGFHGICDTAVAELMRKTLLEGRSGKPKFTYWMTLNSHLPLDSKSGDGASFDCSTSAVTRSDAGVCLHTRAISVVLGKLADIALDPSLPPTVFVVVGDHAPPFMSPEIRALYSPTEVPAVVLEPRGP
jgi:hypothetical protein